MGMILVMCDGSVTGLLAAAAAGLKVATGPRGNDAFAYINGPTDHHKKAALVQAAEFGLKSAPDQSPNETRRVSHGWVRELIDAALCVRRFGGGEVVWPIGPEGCEVDVSASARALTAATLVSELASLGPPIGEPVDVRAPYADLSEDQIADLVLDMDLPIWTCWWMAAAEIGEGELRKQAVKERERWRAALKRAGWAGSLEATVAVQVKSAGPTPPSPVHGGHA